MAGILDSMKRGFNKIIDDPEAALKRAKEGASGKVDEATDAAKKAADAANEAAKLGEGKATDVGKDAGSLMNLLGEAFDSATGKKKDKAKALSDALREKEKES